MGKPQVDIQVDDATGQYAAAAVGKKLSLRADETCCAADGTHEYCLFQVSASRSERPRRARGPAKGKGGELNA